MSANLALRESITYLLGDALATVVTEALMMIGLFLAPFVVFAIIIHLFEGLTQRRLAERFGWSSVMWTGWLGTPIHELSHAAMCWLFRHRVDEIALFEPDRQSGRLGYVRHSFRRGNWFEEVGNLFIGIAPLVGGSLVLSLLLWLFYPTAAATGISSSRTIHQSGGLLSQVWVVATHIGGEVLAWRNLNTSRFWIFMYLVLCVGSHMAPSRSDYQGAARGALLAGGFVLVATFLMAAVGFDLNRMLNIFVQAMGPLLAILGLTVFLVGLSTAAVYLLTAVVPRAYRVD